MKKPYSITREVQIFPYENPWVFVSVPKIYTKKLRHLKDRGLVAITAIVGNSSWPTSLMPMVKYSFTHNIEKYVKKN